MFKSKCFKRDDPLPTYSDVTTPIRYYKIGISNILSSQDLINVIRVEKSCDDRIILYMKSNKKLILKAENYLDQYLLIDNIYSALNKLNL
jgi:hypothetical protein